MRKRFSFLIILLMIAGLISCPYLTSEAFAGSDETITFLYPDFSDADMKALLKLNGHASITSGKLRIVPCSGFRRGSVFYNDKVSLANERSFSTFFSFQLTGSYYKGKADGFVFAIQTNSNTAGSSGGGIGFSGISPSVGIEFDTWRNSPEPSTPHIGLDINGSVSSLKTVRTTPYDIRNGSIYYAWIDYDGKNKKIEVRLSNNSTRPETAILTYENLDLTSILNMDEVYVGFTSATGNAAQNHDILSWYFNNDYEPIDTENITYENDASSVIVTASPSSNTKQSTITATVYNVDGNKAVGNTVTFSTTGGNLSSSTAVTDANGQATVMLSSSGPSAAATVKAVSQAGSYGNVDVQLLANNFPTYTAAETNTSQAIDEGDGLIALAAVDADDGEAVSYTLTGGELPAGIILNNDGSFSGTAGYTSAGNYSVQLCASDGYGGTATTTLNITVRDKEPVLYAHSAGVSCATPTPMVGADNAINLVVKDSLGNTDTSFNGAKDVTISGTAAAPDNTYGSFNGTALDVNSAGAGQIISVTFTNGEATAQLALNKATAQNVTFSIATVTNPNTNTLTITPTAGNAISMVVGRDITAPLTYGGQFAQQPELSLLDQFGNICSQDSSTQITAAQKDSGDWTLTGTASVTAVNGVVKFMDLGATNEDQVDDAQLAFNAAGLTEVTSGAVTLPGKPVASGQTATAQATTNAPVAGANNVIKLVVKNSLGETDTSFNGNKVVIISGYLAAPDNTHGSLGGTELEADGVTNVNLTFTNGEAKANLVLNKAGEQTIAFSITGLATPPTNTLTITPVPGNAVNMVVTQDITAPLNNGGQFAQQPELSLLDQFGNLCSQDSSTQITAVKKDSGEWKLSGDSTIRVKSGLACFTNLRADNNSVVAGAQLAFDAVGMPQMTSTTVTLPAPADDGSSGASNDQGVQILVNGNAQKAGRADTRFDGENVVSIVTVDQQRLDCRLAQEGNNTVVTIPINNDADVVVGMLNGQMIKNMEVKHSVVEVKTETASYKLPAEQIRIDAISRQLGQNVELQDIKVELEIARATNETVAILENQEKKGEFTIVAPPVSFHVKCTHGDKTVEVSSFNSFVERAIAIPEGVEQNKITTGVIVDPDGTIRHVPTRIVLKDGKYYAIINSLTNSAYSVIWNPKVYKDVEDHWAQQPVNEMVSRLVMDEVTEHTFEPERYLTRAEFISIILQALGLKAQAGNVLFHDVPEEESCMKAVATAYAYGLIGGYNDCSFKPYQALTREEAMCIVVRVLKLAGLDTKLGVDEVQNLLVQFEDADDFNSWSKNSAAFCAKYGIIVKTKERANPKSKLTRAEAAAMVMRMLKTANLI